jgi:riboflavin synthase
MFTGLIHGLGRITEIHKRENYLILSISYPNWKGRLEIGESIACDGACLTVVSFKDDCFTVELSQETLARTIANKYSKGSALNLERAMQLSDRLMGHFVSGHIDTVATIVSRQMIGESLELGISYAPTFDKLVIPKGSIAINGVSLTVNEVESGHCTVNLIPHTQTITNLKELQVGNSVNVEFDLIGKYVARFADLGVDMRAEQIKERSW